MNGLIRWFAHNHVAANLLMVILVVGGLFGVALWTMLTPTEAVARERPAGLRWADFGDGGQSLPAVSPLDFRDFPELSQRFDGFAATSSSGMLGFSGALTGDGQPPEVVDLSGVSAGRRRASASRRENLP